MVLVERSHITGKMKDNLRVFSVAIPLMRHQSVAREK
jgi:hypothetical protein